MNLISACAAYLLYDYHCNISCSKWNLV